MSRREREHRFRVDLVLDAAWVEFGEKSLSKTTVGDITKRAEISVGTFYKLFRSKEEIFRHLIEREQARFFALVTDRVEQCLNPTAKIRTTLTVLLELLSLVTSQLRTYVSTSDGVQWDIKEQLAGQVRATHRQFITYVAEICRDGIDEGEFESKLSPESIALNLMTIPHTFVGYALDNPDADLAGFLPEALEIADRMVGLRDDDRTRL